ncbi:alpha/beta fold hydrolase [Umezawaea endophytica]|uniref:Alpha/beta hydrolase n=1 Tax=Umezawaea endophytica TaxID=1654476 RepID=A0A9X2VUB5_9PSEU|nr:alpha/beta hydrolase [Umezawaea endophytica]MCS7482870.1 alpha/beta hydrolase [Umezawaea endophytica]
MTAVFVHGVPETPSVWDVVRERLDVDSVALHLPGFGIPRLPRLTDNEAYAAWLADQLAEMTGPIDLVAHDWGAHLAIRAVSAYDVPVRSWVCDVAEAWHPDFVWHEGAQVIQSEHGREFLTTLRTSPEMLAGFLEPRGINAHVMADIAQTVDEVMTDTMYLLYRDATPNFYAYKDWGHRMEQVSGVPGLVVAPEEDPYGDVELSRQTAERLGAQFVRLPGKSHYWMHQDPDAAVQLLNTFWRGIDRHGG